MNPEGRASHCGMDSYLYTCLSKGRNLVTLALLAGRIPGKPFRKPEGKSGVSQGDHEPRPVPLPGALSQMHRDPVRWKEGTETNLIFHS